QDGKGTAFHPAPCPVHRSHSGQGHGGKGTILHFFQSRRPAFFVRFLLSAVIVLQLTHGDFQTARHSNGHFIFTESRRSFPVSLPVFVNFPSVIIHRYHSN